MFFGTRWDVNNTSATEVLNDIVQLFTGDSLEVFIPLLQDLISDDIAHFHDGDVHLQFVQSGFVLGGFIPTMDNYVARDNYISEDGIDVAPKIQQRIYGTLRFGPTKKKHFSYVLMKGEQEGRTELWIAKVVALFHMSCHGRKQELAFVQFMQCTPPLDHVDDILQCVCLRWATEDGVDHTVTPVPTRGRPVLAGDWYGIEPVQSILGTVHVVRSNFAVSPYTQELPWSHHRFYVNRFYRDFT